MKTVRWRITVAATSPRSEQPPGESIGCRSPMRPRTYAAPDRTIVCQPLRRLVACQFIGVLIYFNGAASTEMHRCTSGNTVRNVPEEMIMHRARRAIVTVAAISFCNVGPVLAQDGKDIQKQLDEVRSASPKFAIPMREVGDRFQNMYFAAKDGNWALAAYMSKYMNNSMNPASVTRPVEYKV